MSGLRVFSPAKINLHLDILRRRPDGFHELSTVFVALDWGDELTLEPAPGSEDVLEAVGPFAEETPADASNLVLRAATLLRERTGGRVPPVRMRLHKRIPPQSGLGGGSSNAAAALVGLDELFALQTDRETLARIAAELGSDCAFFLDGGTQAATGRGEVLRPVAMEQLFSLLVVVPRATVGTAEAFAQLDPAQLGARTEQRALLEWLACDDAVAMPELYNAFEEQATARFPEIAATLERLRQFGAERAMLSGSGSACFGIFPVREEAENAAALWDLGARAIEVCWPWPAGARAMG